MESVQPSGELVDEIYDLEDVRARAREIVQKARETKRPMLIADGGKPVAAIVDLGALEDLHTLIDQLDDKAVALEFIAEEARGEVEWISDEEMRAYQQQLINEVLERAAKRGADVQLSSDD